MSAPLHCVYVLDQKKKNYTYVPQTSFGIYFHTYFAFEVVVEFTVVCVVFSFHKSFFIAVLY